jgi:hypothetical protein
MSKQFKNPLNNPLEKISLSLCRICECWLCFVYPALVAFEGTYTREKLKPNEVEFLSQNVFEKFSFVILLGSVFPWLFFLLLFC